MRKLLWILTLMVDGGWVATYVVTGPTEPEMAQMLALLALNGITATAEVLSRVKTNGHGGGQGHLHG